MIKILIVSLLIDLIPKLFFRWRELMETSSPGGLGQMKVLLVKMPDVAEVMGNIMLFPGVSLG